MTIKIYNKSATVYYNIAKDDKDFVSPKGEELNIRIQYTCTECNLAHDLRFIDADNRTGLHTVIFNSLHAG